MPSRKEKKAAAAAPDVSSLGDIHFRGHATGSLFAAGSPLALSLPIMVQLLTVWVYYSSLGTTEPGMIGPATAILRAHSPRPQVSVFGRRLCSMGHAFALEPICKNNYFWLSDHEAIPAPGPAVIVKPAPPFGARPRN